MRFVVAAAALSALLIAAAGCSSQGERHRAAEAALKAALEGTGLRKVSVQSVSDGVGGSIVLRGISAQAGDDVSVAVKQIELKSPDLGPMLVKWHDFGRIEIGNWVIYGGYGPKPTGFVAEGLEAKGVTMAVASQPLRIEAGSFVLEGFDSTRPGALRYEGYRIRDAALLYRGREAARVAEAEVESGLWTDGISSPLRTKGRLEGSVSLAAAAVFLPSFLPPKIVFSAVVESGVDLEAGRLSISQSIDTEGFGRLSGELEIGGVERKLVEALGALAKDGTKGKKPAETDVKKQEQDAKAMQELMAAAAGMSLVSYRMEGSGLEWLGGVFDGISGGDREAFANTVVRFMDTGFAGPEKSDKANASLAGMALFIANPSSFELSLEPQKPFVFATEGFRHYMNPGSGPLDALGLGFRNTPY